MSTYYLIDRLPTTFVSGSQLTATVPASDIATASTASITVFNPSPGGGTSFVSFLEVSAPTNLTFASIPASNVPSGPPIAADFNRDGKLDFAVLAEVEPEEGNTASVFLGTATAHFRPQKSSVVAIF